MRRSVLSIAAAALLGAGCGSSGDDGEFDPWVLEELGPAEGFSLRTPEFDVPAGTEIQDCYFARVPDLGADELWIDRIVTGINPGSHHVNVFRVRTIQWLDPADGEPVDLGSVEGTLIAGGECWNSGNWSDWPLVANSQKSGIDDPVNEWRLPDGVGLRFEPGELLMLQVHYVNATTQATPWRGRVGINFHRSEVAEPVEMGTMFATQQSIRICRSRPNPQVYSGTCSFPAGTQIRVDAANGHFHSRGRRFEIFSWDGRAAAPGERFYESTSWDEPPMATGLDVEVPPGGGIWWTCTFDWVEPSVEGGGCDAVDAADEEGEGDCCYTFGPKVETSEHCNVFLYYWPKVGETDVFCN
jgi:hypothetical protein